MSESRYVFDNAAEQPTRERFAALPRLYDPGTVHLPAREAVLTRLVAARKPGGWLLLEEFDSLSIQLDPTLNPVERRPRLYDALYRLMAERGADVCFGRRLPGRLRAHGLVDVDAKGRVFLVQAGSPWADLMKANFEQLRAPISAAEGLTAEEFDRELAYLDDQDLINPSSVMWAVWGRRP